MSIHRCFSWCIQWASLHVAYPQRYDITQLQVPGLLKIWLEVMTQQIPNDDACKDLPRKMPIIESLLASLASAVRNVKIAKNSLFADDIQDRHLGDSNNQKSHHYLWEEVHHLVQSNLAVDLKLFTEAYSEQIASLQDAWWQSWERGQSWWTPCWARASWLVKWTHWVRNDRGLQCVFVESYKQVNALNGKTNDLLFRVAKWSATFSRADGNTNRNLESTGAYAYNVTTVYYCRGCSWDYRLLQTLRHGVGTRFDFFR